MFRRCRFGCGWVLAFFFGGGGTVAWRYSDTGAVNGGGGLVGLLVLFAGIALLFTAQYPAGIFDAVLGMDRWAVRVVAYAALATDVYAPFRARPERRRAHPGPAAAVAGRDWGRCGGPVPVPPDSVRA